MSDIPLNRCFKSALSHMSLTDDLSDSKQLPRKPKDGAESLYQQFSVWANENYYTFRLYIISTEYINATITFSDSVCQ